MKPLILSSLQAQSACQSVKFDEKGMALAIACDHASGSVLMVAWMTRETLLLTLTTGRMTYWSRSRQEIWVKGLTSGHVQDVVGVELDCDGDALRFRVVQHGNAACHTGRRDCFFRTLVDGKWTVLSDPPTLD